MDIQKKFPLNCVSSQGSYHNVYSPNDNALLSKVQYLAKEDLTQLKKVIQKSQDKVISLSSKKRSEYLQKISQSILEKKSWWARLIAIDGGKPLKDALVEVERASKTFSLAAKQALSEEKEYFDFNENEGVSFLEPIGAVFAISAFNHPLNLMAHQFGCALASGNTTLFKSSPSTTLCAHYLELLLKELNIPPEVFLCINCENELIDEILKFEFIEFVTFIGAEKIGWQLREKVCPGVRLNLEHGGMASSIITSSANLETALNKTLKSCFYHAGQVCISTQHLFIHQNLYEDFKLQFCGKVKNLKVDNALNPETDLGPLIHEGHFKRISELIQDALQNKAQLLCGGEGQTQDGFYYQPTVIENLSENARLNHEEAFGPVVCLHSYRNEEIVLQRLQKSPYHFSHSIFTEDVRLANELIGKVPSMVVAINEGTAKRYDEMPFGGHRHSGLGLGGIKYLVKEMSRTKLVISPKQFL